MVPSFSCSCFYICVKAGLQLIFIQPCTLLQAKTCLSTSDCTCTNPMMHLECMHRLSLAATDFVKVILEFFAMYTTTVLQGSRIVSGPIPTYETSNLNCLAQTIRTSQTRPVYTYLCIVWSVCTCSLGRRIVLFLRFAHRSYVHGPCISLNCGCCVQTM